MTLAQKMTGLPVFLAYSAVLEEEAADRHDELADVMEVHNNPDVAETFRKLAHYSRLHAQEIREHSKNHELPKIAPWDFEWEGAEPPETTDSDEVNYLMNRAQALRLAMQNEQRAHDFYAEISRDAPSVEVRELAAEFAQEEKEHLELLEAWQEKIPEDEDEVPFDPDPAHMPE